MDTQRAVPTDRGGALDVRPLRFAVRPWYPKNHYLERFYEALGPAARAVHRQVVIRDSWLREQRDNIDVLHFHWPESVWRTGQGILSRTRTLTGFWTYLRRARAMGYAVWWTAHNLAPHDAPGVLDHIGMCILARQADLIICHSDWSRAEVVRRFQCQPARILTIELPPALDVRAYALRSRQEYRRQFGVPDDAIVFACPGHIRAYKNLVATAEAVAALSTQTNAHLIVGGSPHDSDVVRQLEAVAARCPRVRVIPRRLEDEEFGGMVRACDAVVVPYTSVTNSSVLVDALCGGRPVVASRHPVFEEIARKAPGAVLFADGASPAALEAALRSFIGNRESALAAAGEFRPATWWSAVQPIVQRLQSV